MRPVTKFLLVSSLFTTADVSALPSSARLFQKKYGYKVSCLLCHANGGGSAASSYGKDFLRAGANSTSFSKIESKDSDDDGIVNLKEILAKSNAGDKRSTPKNAGPWLDNLAEVFIPQDELERLFPGYKSFSALEGSLSDRQISFLESNLSGNVPDDDKVPTFYFALKEGKKEAVGQLVPSKASNGKTLVTGVAVGVDGKVRNVLILGGDLEESAKSESAFAKGLEEQNLADLAEQESSAENGTPAKKLIFNSVKRSLLLMQSVFGGGK